MDKHISIQREDFDAGAEARQLTADDTGVGAVATFTGLVRARNEGDRVSGLELEHYPGMTERRISEIVDEAAERWPVRGACVIHRIGALNPGDQIVFVAVSSANRGAAFAACEFIMDFLKTRAPFWKKETTPDGERWVEARESDEKALDRWQ